MALDGTIVTVGGVDAKVMVDGYRKGNSWGGGPWRELVYKVAWVDSDKFMDALLGVVKYSTAGSAVTWPIPHAYPGNAALFCVEATGETHGPVGPDPVKVVSADECLVYARYQALPWDVLGNQADMAFGGVPVPWSRDTFRSYVESYPVEKGILLYESGANSGKPTPTKVHARVPHVEFHRTLYMVPYVWIFPLIPLMGKVNSGAVWGMPKGTLRVDPWETDIENDTSGGRFQSFSFSLTWRPYDWNAELEPDRLVWTTVKDPVNGYLYPYADLTPLLTYAT